MLRQKWDCDCPLLCCSFLPLTCKQDLVGQANGKSQTSGCLKGSLGPHACPWKLDGEIWGSMDSLAGLVLCGVSLLLSGKVWLYYFFKKVFFLTVSDSGLSHQRLLLVNKGQLWHGLFLCESPFNMWKDSPRKSLWCELIFLVSLLDYCPLCPHRCCGDWPGHFIWRDIFTVGHYFTAPHSSLFPYSIQKKEETWLYLLQRKSSVAEKKSSLCWEWWGPT